MDWIFTFIDLKRALISMFPLLPKPILLNDLGVAPCYIQASVEVFFIRLFLTVMAPKL